ncbi:MAG: Rrf2 family transcriptional regulator [Deltaproteobacteria bacterium]|nr:Rrf2 family transcriptional regulator [Deltaproteobacteria bacterium]
MLSFNRKTEYALIAIEHMARKKIETLEGGASEQLVTSAREVAEHYQIPLSLMAKVFQQLAAKGLVKSVHGYRGGYLLARDLDEVSVADVAEIFEGPVAVTDCLKEERITCPQWDGCRIRHPLHSLNYRIYHMLQQTSLAELTQAH